MVKISVGMMYHSILCCLSIARDLGQHSTRGSSVASGSSSLATPTQVSSFLKIVKSHGVKELDTARVYNGGKSEELLGEVNANKDFLIATKAPAFVPGSLKYENIVANCEKSLKALQVDKVDLYYLHGPDAETSLEEQCRAIDTLYRDGKFDRWGISNLSPPQVQSVYDICQKNGYAPPAVYQGGYNPINRQLSEPVLFPLLKKLNIAFYAYSPLAGGLLAKPVGEILKPEKGSRFDSMAVFGNMYLTEENIEALRKVQSACDSHSISLVEATIRWFVHHSPLGKDDAVILGASSDSQIERSLSACEKDPLPESLLTAFEELKNSAVVGDPFKKR